MSSTSSVVPTPTNALLNRQFRACGSPMTFLHASSVGINWRNGMIAPGLKMSAWVFRELSMAQRKGTATQIAARHAIAIATSFDAHFELRQSRFSIASDSQVLFDAFAHLFEEIANHDRRQNQVDDAHRRSPAEIGKLDCRQIRHDAKELGTRTVATAG